MAVNDSRGWKWWEIGLCLGFAGLVLLLHGAVPFLMMPTLGQAIWSMGFSQSFANGPWYSLYAHDFGVPAPAAIAFGLAGALPASLFIRLGLHPADSYSAMSALWLLTAFASCYGIGRHFGATRFRSLLGALAWMSMPIIWGHSGYSMLSVGIALLPFYMLTALKLFFIGSGGWMRVVPAAGAYSLAVMVSVFMDGYSFMMFAVASTFFVLYLIYVDTKSRPILLRVVLPVHMACFTIAYLAFVAYIGKPIFQAHTMESFRGWGLDLSYLAIPTEGTHWLPDVLGLSVNRIAAKHFGDSSVWETTFLLPTLITGLVAWWGLRANKLAVCILLVGLFGLYMALGPSLKIYSIKPEYMQLQSPLMPAEFAIMPTGNAAISENVPGFNVMRAAYRWSALCVFSLWLLIVIKLSSRGRRQTLPWVAALTAIVLLNLPNMQSQWLAKVDFHRMFEEIDSELIADLRSDLRNEELVAFIPWGNDFLVNYLAPRSGFRAINIGGDKNLLEAQRNWPSEMFMLNEPLNAGKAFAAVKMLVERHADALVVPYFHPLWSAHVWPCWALSQSRIPAIARASVSTQTDFYCPEERKKQLEPFLSEIGKFPYMDVEESTLYSIIRLKPQFGTEAAKAQLTQAIKRGIRYPILLGEDFKEHPYVLYTGWHGPEARHVWSTAEAALSLPVPDLCRNEDCRAKLTFVTFGASASRPVHVLLEVNSPHKNWRKEVIATSSEAMEVGFPLSSEPEAELLSISIPAATSPLRLNGSPDSRVLGIALQRIDLDAPP